MAQYIRYPALTGSGTLTGSATGVPYIMGPLDGAALNNFGATIGSFSLYMQSATALIPGLVSSAAQTFSGVKRFQNNVGIGNNAPDTLLTISSNTAIVAAPVNTNFHMIGADGAQNRAVFDAHNALTGGGPGFIGRRSRGTAASPTAVIADDTLAFLGASGYGTSAFGTVTGGTLSFKATTGWTDASQGTYMHVSLNISSSTTTVERMRLDGTGVITLSGYAGAAGVITVGSGGAFISGSVSLTTQVSGKLPIANTSGSVSLTNQVVGILPAANLPAGTQIGSVSLTNQVVGILPTANGGSTGTNTGDVTLGVVGTTPGVNAASLSGQILTLQPADATNPGIVSSSVQVFLGAKTFNTSVSSKSVIVGSVTMSQTAAGATYSVSFPIAQGSSSAAALVNDGTGVLSWSVVPGSYFCSSYYPASNANYWTNTNGSTSDFTVVGTIPTPTVLINNRMGAIAKATSSLPGINIASAPRTGTVKVTCTYSLLPGTLVTTADWTTTLIETVGSSILGIHSGNITANNASNAQFPLTMVGYFNATSGNAINLKLQSGITGPTTAFIGGNIAPSSGTSLSYTLEYLT